MSCCHGEELKLLFSDAEPFTEDSTENINGFTLTGKKRASELRR